MCSKSKVEMKHLTLLWSRLFDSAPKLYIPFTKFDIGFTIISFFVICTLRLLNEYIFINILNFNPTTYKTIESAAALTSLEHALVLCSGLWAVLRSQPYDVCARMESAPKQYQKATTALLEMCTGYMFYDAVFMFRANNWSLHPEDGAFLGHHIVTVLYMSQTRVLGVGHISALALMFTGELSNPAQNLHLITKFAIQMSDDGSFFHVLHPFVELTFAIMYFILRGFVGPYQVISISYTLLFTKKGRESVWLPIGMLWSMMICGIILGSIPWTKEAWGMIADGLDVKYDKTWDYGPRYELYEL